MPPIILRIILIVFGILQVCLDSGAKKILMPAISMSDFASVPDDLSTAFDIILYKNAEEAVIKALSVG